MGEKKERRETDRNKGKMEGREGEKIETEMGEEEGGRNKLITRDAVKNGCDSN